MRGSESLSMIACETSRLLLPVSLRKESCVSINPCLICGGTNWGLTTSQFGAVGSVLGLERPRLFAKSELELRELVIIFSAYLLFGYVSLPVNSPTSAGVFLNVGRRPKETRRLR